MDATAQCVRCRYSLLRFLPTHPTRSEDSTSTLPALATPSLMAAPAPRKAPESLVTVLYESLTDKQKKEVCFDWNHVDPKRGLLRTRLENNWKITKPSIKSNFYTKEQQALAHQIFRGMTHPDWYSRFDQQLKDDVRTTLFASDLAGRRSQVDASAVATDGKACRIAADGRGVRCDPIKHSQTIVKTSGKFMLRREPVVDRDD